MKKNVLVIDDDEDILEAFTLALGDAGYAVQTFSNFDDKSEKQVLKNPPDMVLCDLLLSGDDGTRICKEFKKNPKLKKIPFVIISAHPTIEDGARAAGADDFLAKPFTIKNLIDKIEHHTSKHK